MSERDFTEEIRSHLRQPLRTPEPVQPADLDRSHERTSADGRVSASVNGLSLEVESVVVHRGDDPDAVAVAVVEAVNAALEAAESGPLGAGLDESVGARVAQMDEQMEQLSGRLDELSARLDRMLGS